MAPSFLTGRRSRATAALPKYGVGGARGICCGLGADQCGLTRESGVPVPPGPVEEGLRERVQHPGTLGGIQPFTRSSRERILHQFTHFRPRAHTPVTPRPSSSAHPHSTLHLHTLTHVPPALPRVCWGTGEVGFCPFKEGFNTSEGGFLGR